METNQIKNYLSDFYAWYKSRSKKNKKTFWIIFVVLALAIIGHNNPSSSSNSSGSSSSSGSHTCNQCGKSFTGRGWSSIGGEQYQPTDFDGSSCSSSCAYNAQPSKWKK